MQHNPSETVILLVEDDEGHAELIKMNLERSGVANQVVHFKNGQAAIDFLQRGGKPFYRKYIILLDVNMPGLDGKQVLERLKNHDLTAAIPVIMLTTAADEREVDRCYELGCNLYINKPMDYDAFGNSVEQLGRCLQTARLPGLNITAM